MAVATPKSIRRGSAAAPRQVRRMLSLLMSPCTMRFGVLLCSRATQSATRSSKSKRSVVLEDLSHGEAPYSRSSREPPGSHAIMRPYTSPPIFLPQANRPIAAPQACSGGMPRTMPINGKTKRLAPPALAFCRRSASFAIASSASAAESIEASRTFTATSSSCRTQNAL